MEEGHPNRRRNEIRHLLRAPAAAALGRGRRGEAARATRSTRSSSPTRSASTTCGRSSTTSSRSTRTRARPRCSWRPRASAPRTSGSATASCRSRPASTTPRASPSASATLDLISGGRVEFGTGESSSQAELGAFGVDREAKRDAVGGGARRDHAHVRGGAVRRLRRPLHLDAAALGACRSRSRSRTRRCGSRAAGARRSCWPRGAGIGALTFAFIEPEEAKEWVDEYYGADPVRRVRPGRLRGQPELRRRAADDAARGRGDRDRARHRRRALLRLLARALLRVRRPPAGRHERLGRVPGQARRVRLRARDHQRRRRAARASRSSSRAWARCAARSARRSRSSSWSQRYEARGRRPGDLRAAGRARTSTSTSASRSSCSARRCCRTSPTGARSARPPSASGSRRRASGRSRGARRRARPTRAT